MHDAPTPSEALPPPDLSVVSSLFGNRAPIDPSMLGDTPIAFADGVGQIITPDLLRGTEERVPQEQPDAAALTPEETLAKTKAEVRTEILGALGAKLPELFSSDPEVRAAAYTSLSAEERRTIRPTLEASGMRITKAEAAAQAVADDYTLDLHDQYLQHMLADGAGFKEWMATQPDDTRSWWRAFTSQKLQMGFDLYASSDEMRSRFAAQQQAEAQARITEASKGLDPDEFFDELLEDDRIKQYIPPEKRSAFSPVRFEGSPAQIVKKMTKVAYELVADAIAEEKAGPAAAEMAKVNGRATAMQGLAARTPAAPGGGDAAGQTRADRFRELGTRRARNEPFTPAERDEWMRINSGGDDAERGAGHNALRAFIGSQ